jgi:hypothetical protein
MNSRISTLKRSFIVFLPFAILSAYILLRPPDQTTNKAMPAQASRAKVYSSLSQFSVDDGRPVLLSQVGEVRRETINGLNYPVATFEVLNSVTWLDSRVVVVMPSNAASWKTLSSKRLLAYISPLTYRDGRKFPQWVFTGDGAGVFIADKSGAVSRSTTFSRLDDLSIDLPKSGRAAELGLSLGTP